MTGSGPTAPRDPWVLPDVSSAVVGVLGGTGPQGRGLATRLAAAGHRVRIGSRDGDRARAAATGIAGDVLGGTNLEAAEAEIVILAVQWSGHEALCRELAPTLAGRIIVDCVNPLGFDEAGCFSLPVAQGSAAQQAAELLPGSRVTAAFNHVSSALLLDLTRARIDGDVLVCGDDRDATDRVQALVQRIPGLRGVYCGNLRTAGHVEAMTANLLAINKRYKVNAGFRVAGL